MTKNKVFIKREEEVKRVLKHFDTEYGAEESKLEAWQRLCTDVGISPCLSITKCKKALKGVHVNIVDFIAAKRTGQEVHHFPSRNALRKYTRANKGKRFPLAKAKENGFLSALLIRL